MKVKLLAPSFVLLTVAFTFFSCVKQDPTHPNPPTDSTGVNLKKGLLVYLPFSGNYADSSGNNNPTQLVGPGGGLTSDVKGAASSAFSSDGTGGRIEVTNNGSIHFDSAFTISVNFLEHSYINRQALATMVRVESGKGVSFLLSNSIPGASNVAFAVVNTTGGCDNYGEGRSTNDTTNFIPQQDTWYNLVGVFDKGTLRTYLNGTLISQTTGMDPRANFCQQAKFVAGGWWQNDPISINGKLDEVRLYNRALNSQEIAKLAEGFSVQPPPPPVADLKRGLLLYLPFNGSIADSSGNNNPTQIVGSGAGLTYDIHGYANAAYGADGSGGRLEVTNNGSIKFDSTFTVSMSFMERQLSTNTALATMVNTADGTGPAFFIGNSMQISSNVWFGVPRGITCAQAGTHDATDTTNFAPQPDSWYNLICTFNRGAFKVYVNGKLVSQTTVSAYNAQICPNAKVVVGGWWSGGPIDINGKIDNFRLYNREINSNEIALLSQYYQPNTNSSRGTGTGKSSQF